MQINFENFSYRGAWKIIAEFICFPKVDQKLEKKNPVNQTFNDSSNFFVIVIVNNFFSTDLFCK